MSESPTLFPSLPSPLRALFRVYGVALSLTVAPAFLSILSSKKANHAKWELLARLLRRQFSATGFPFAMILALSGDFFPQILQDLYGKKSRQGRPSDEARAFMSTALTSYVGMALLQRGSRRPRPFAGSTVIPYTVPNDTTLVKSGMSPTWDITLIFFVRAFDAWCQRIISRHRNRVDGEAGPSPASRSGSMDAALFWAASSRIMWCFFYKPHSLPPSYVKWIGAMAALDQRLLETLRAIQAGTFSYSKGVTPPGLLTSMASDMGTPASWGDPKQLSATGGTGVRDVYRALGTQRAVGGIPCELVHGHVDQKSCAANAARRGAVVFLKALMIYSPVHFLSTIIAHPRQLFNLAKLLTKSLSVVRSSLFLSTFVGSMWMTVCIVRTLIVARLFPNIPHDFYDGPYGCVLASCLVCGSSIFIEEPRRRAEMALYVLPRAIRTLLPTRWMRTHGQQAKVFERLIFATSVASLVAAQRFRPDTLRGLSKWALAYITKDSAQAVPKQATVATGDNLTVATMQ